jgi:glycosyltransferase involved in cell wall biosynthesis
VKQIRVLYSFPHRIGASRICTTAWHQVAGAALAGADVIAMPASIVRPLPATVRAVPTLAAGRWRLPFRAIGDRRAFWLHDYIVSRRLEALGRSVDIVHAWPMGALRTLEVAARLGIPTVLERPNAHTRYAYEVVRAECQRIGVALPRGHEHAFNDAVLAREEREYAKATALLCPSDFVARTFRERGFSDAVLMRHQYGFDADLYRPPPGARTARPGLEMLFVGGCAPRKGLHFALDAWLASPACALGRFRIAGAFVPGYAEHLAAMLSHPSVEVLGHRGDVADLMRASDMLVLPSIEEGSALVTSEARGSGCVILVSDAAGAICRHLHEGLVHRAGDVAELQAHITLMHEDRKLLERLRENSLRGRDEITWDAAGRRLLAVYHQTIASQRPEAARPLDGRVPEAQSHDAA